MVDNDARNEAMRLVKNHGPLISHGASDMRALAAAIVYLADVLKRPA